MAAASGFVYFVRFERGPGEEVKELVERSGRLTEGEVLEVAGVTVKVVEVEYQPGEGADDYGSALAERYEDVS
jgi:hypothetical protein